MNTQYILLHSHFWVRCSNCDNPGYRKGRYGQATRMSNRLDDPVDRGRMFTFMVTNWRIMVDNINYANP